jgi:glycosyltransferase involved in cell wall biosynthesis
MKISILIPCHNEEKSIRACVQSCLDQTRKPDQILVVNDGSIDKSAKITQYYNIF